MNPLHGDACTQWSRPVGGSLHGGWVSLDKFTANSLTLAPSPAPQSYHFPNSFPDPTFWNLSPQASSTDEKEAKRTGVPLYPVHRHPPALPRLEGRCGRPPLVTLREVHPLLSALGTNPSVRAWHLSPEHLWEGHPRYLPALSSSLLNIYLSLSAGSSPLAFKCAQHSRGFLSPAQPQSSPSLPLGSHKSQNNHQYWVPSSLPHSASV